MQIEIKEKNVAALLQEIEDLITSSEQSNDYDDYPHLKNLTKQLGVKYSNKKSLEQQFINTLLKFIKGGVVIQTKKHDHKLVHKEGNYYKIIGEYEKQKIELMLSLFSYGSEFEFLVYLKGDNKDYVSGQTDRLDPSGYYFQKIKLYISENIKENA